VDGFEAWYRASAPRLAAALAVVAGDADVGREVAAEACTRALERWGRVKDMDCPEAWAHRVGVNLIRRRWRRAAIERRLSGPPPAPAAPVSLSPEVWSAVRALPVRQRQAVALRYVLDLTQEQVADAMGVAPGTAAATLSAARKQLRTLLDVPQTEEAHQHGRA
jgi:RNA polymerase sigma-70 factor, ECF subfamily